MKVAEKVFTNEDLKGMEECQPLNIDYGTTTRPHNPARKHHGVKTSRMFLLLGALAFLGMLMWTEALDLDDLIPFLDSSDDSSDSSDSNDSGDSRDSSDVARKPAFDPFDDVSSGIFSP